MIADRPKCSCDVCGLCNR